jgi:hypothetical protein
MEIQYSKLPAAIARYLYHDTTIQYEVKKPSEDPGCTMKLQQHPALSRKVKRASKTSNKLQKS